MGNDSIKLVQEAKTVDINSFITDSSVPNAYKTPYYYVCEISHDRKKGIKLSMALTFDNCLKSDDGNAKIIYNKNLKELYSYGDKAELDFVRDRCLKTLLNH